MAIKTISITEEAYGRLKALKREKESFTNAILRLTKKRSLLDLAGILAKREASELRKRIKEGRKISRKRLDKLRLKL